MLVYTAITGNYDTLQSVPVGARDGRDLSPFWSIPQIAPRGRFTLLSDTSQTPSATHGGTRFWPTIFFRRTRLPCGWMGRWKWPSNGPLTTCSSI